MLSINTNLSSLIAQSSLKSSTQLLNQAVERMTTGYKINGAKDNAANYSISTNMNTQLSAYDVAADNVAMGMDLVTTASDIISMMQDKASRLHALSTQARNGTYGAQSLDAINTEASAIMAEITRLYMTSEYNGLSLFDRKAYELTPEHKALCADVVAKEEYNGFIADPKTYTDAEVAAMTPLSDSVTSVSSGQKYSISSVEELENLAELVNNGKSTTGAIFVLGADIDLKDYGNWTPIGDYNTNSSYQFKGTFDGNGHVIKNLTIDNSTKDYQGLFGRTASGSEIKNIGLVGGSVKGKNSVGGLVGLSRSSITNSYATGNVTGSSYEVGGLVGDSSSSITNSYATGDVTGSSSSVGGLVGNSSSSSITNSYATGDVTGSSPSVGGLVGYAYSSSITNSYATGNVTGSSSYVGGLVGDSSFSSISNSYATGDVSGTNYVGGLVGSSSSSSITNSYATGNVLGTEDIGGLAGRANNVNNSYATGSVSGTENVGGLLGSVYSGASINDSYSTGDMQGDSFVGGLVGQVYCCDDNVEISKSISYSSVQGDEAAGSFVGGVVGTYYCEWNYGDGDEGIDEYSNGELLLTNCSAIYGDTNYIGGYYKWIDIDINYEDPDTGDYIQKSYYAEEIVADYDLSVYDANITAVALKKIVTSLQVGINSDDSNQINFDTNFRYSLNAVRKGIETEGAFNAINEFLTLLNDKSTMLGAIENKLNSALDSIEVNINNLTSSLSTIRDADMAKESASYIQQQILQEASATLLATANQSPSIALQLI